jgi:hypothetical protein
MSVSFKEYKNLDYAVLADEILDFWNERDSLRLRFLKDLLLRTERQVFTT